MGVLRLVLAAGVALGHFRGRDTFAGGQGSVQCFYMISGFFIALILNEKYVRPGDLLLFYRNRALRIFGLYWIFLALAVAISIVTLVVAHNGPLATWSDYWSRLSPRDIAYLLTTNLLVFAQEATLFLRFGHSGLTWTAHFQQSMPWVLEFMFVGPGWSLGLELLFYLIAPFIVRRSPWTIGTAIAASVVARGIGYAFGLRQDPWSYRFFPFELAFFLAGALSYRVYVTIRHMPVGVVARLAGYSVFPAILLFPLYEGELTFSPGRILLYAYVIVSVPLLFHLTRDSRWDRWVGELSYPLYLCHFAIFNLCLLSSRLAEYPHARILVVFALSMVVSVVVVRYIDAPLERFRHRRLRQRPAASSQALA